MFGSGPSAYEAVHTGKKIMGLPSRKGAQFSLGWDQSNQMNEFQERKSKKSEITGKIGDHTSSVQKPSSVLQPVKQIPNNRDLYSEMDPKLVQYQRLLREYPDIPAEQLQRIVMGFDDKNTAHQSNLVGKSYNENSYNYVAKGNGNNTSQSSQRQDLFSSQKRTAIKPRESMKEIIYGGDIGTQNENPKKAAFRRNNTNLILGDGYNYFKTPY